MDRNEVSSVVSEDLRKYSKLYRLSPGLVVNNAASKMLKKGLWVI